MQYRDQIKGYLELYVRQLELDQDRGPIQQWRYHHFLKLSEDIFEKSRVNISHTTLIRILQRGAFKRSPQPVTLDALARFLDYRDWDHFCQEVNASTEAPYATVIQAKGHEYTAPKAAWTSFRRIRHLFPVLLIISLLVAFWAIATSPKTHESSAFFRCLNPSGTFPHHFSFHYRVPGAGYALVFTPKSYDHFVDLAKIVDKGPSKLFVPLSAVDSIYTHVSELPPDHYRVILLHQEKAIQESSIAVYTDGWLGKTSFSGQKGLRALFYEPLRSPSGWLEIPAEVLAKVERNLVRNDFRSSYSLIDSFGIDGNHFALTARFQFVNQRLPLNCEFVRIKVQTTRGMIEMPLARPGCLDQLYVFASEYYVNSRKNDLRNYGISTDGWLDLRVMVENMTVTFWLGDSLIDAISYQERLGEISGIKIGFLGEGILDSVGIDPLDGTDGYHESFLANPLP